MQLTPDLLQQKALERDARLSSVARYLEPAMTVASGVASEPLAGLAGLMTANPENVANVHHALTYMPRTEAGREGLHGLGDVLSGLGGRIMDTPYLGAAIENFGRSADYLGEEVSPVLGAGLKTAPAFLALTAAPGARSAFGNVGGEIGQTIASGGNVGRGMAAGQRGAVNPSVMAAPLMQAAKTFKLSRAGGGAVGAERFAERVGKGLERTHKTYTAEQVADHEEKPKGRNLLAH